MENRNGFVAGAEATLATGVAEREAAARLTKDPPGGERLGADKTCDGEAFVEDLKAREIAPHIAINGTVSKRGKIRKTVVPPTVAASIGYEISMRRRKQIEEVSGWGKVIGGLGQLKLRGLAKVRAVFTFRTVAYNLIRLPKLLQATGDVCFDGGK